MKYEMDFGDYFYSDDADLPDLEGEDLWSNLDIGLDKLDLLKLPLDECTYHSSEYDPKLKCWTMMTAERKERVHHDCMWSSPCTDKFHPFSPYEQLGCSQEQFTPPSPVSCHPFKTVAPASVLKADPLLCAQVDSAAPNVTDVQTTLQSALPGRSLLLNATRNQPTPTPIHHQPNQRKLNVNTRTYLPASHPPSPLRPDTPQSLDEDESPQIKQEILTVDMVKCPKIEIMSDCENEDEDDQDDDEDEDYLNDEDQYEAYESPRDSRPTRENTVANDHSYTLNKNSKPPRVDLPGVQTPSDSEEEIDVVSLGEKMVNAGRVPILPQNPSPMARRQLQRTMASAVAERTGLSARPPPPQPRKRNLDRSLSPILIHRKRTKGLAKPTPLKASPAKRRAYSSPNSDSEAENIERRSLHNDMERQRRIGLKNLFDELKTEVPAISGKERAPKVVVLREATALCKYFAKCQSEMDSLKAKQQSLLVRVRQLRLDLASQRPKNA